MRGRVDVFALDQPVLEREHVDAVPLELPALALRASRPFADHEPFAHVQPPAGEAQARRVVEDAVEMLADGVSLDALVRGPVVEDEAGRVHRDDRVDVLPVPRVVVALDRLAESVRIVPVRHSPDRTVLRLSTRSSPMRRVTPSASNRSRRSCAGFREIPRRSRNRASVIRPDASSSDTRLSRARSYADGATA